VTEPRIIFHTRKGCHLCDEIWPVLERVAAECGMTVQASDVDGDAELRARHGDWVPVVEIDGAVRLRGKISPAWLEREVRAAAARPVPAVKRIRVGVAIVFDGPLMLVNKRPEGSYFGGWWEWPGGKCELGETPLGATIRELKEEIGIEADGWSLFDRRKAEYPGRVVDLWFYCAKREAGSAPRPDALEHQWLVPDEVKKLRFLEPNLPVLERLIAAGIDGTNPTKRT
jgi:8-oxo-dGTP diphosphatase